MKATIAMAITMAEISHQDDVFGMTEVLGKFGGKSGPYEEAKKISDNLCKKLDVAKEWLEVFPLFLKALRWPEYPGRFKIKNGNGEFTFVFNLKGKPFFPQEMKAKFEPQFKQISLKNLNEFEIVILVRSKNGKERVLIFEFNKPERKIKLLKEEK